MSVMSTRASPEQQESLTRPSQSTYTPRGVCLSLKSSTPLGYTLTASDRPEASPPATRQKKGSPFVEESAQIGVSGLSFIAFKDSAEEWFGTRLKSPNVARPFMESIRQRPCQRTHAVSRRNFEGPRPSP